MSKTVLLTSVCRPIGPQYGDAPSVGYELLYRQVTRAQGIFSPRTVNVFFGLDYIAENLDVPAVVLQYPSRRELIKELKKGYDYVGVSFIMALMHKMKETVALIRQYAPNSKIVLGGYGTILKDEVLKPYADFICREEGVGYFRRLLGEPEIPMPYKQPLMVSWLKVFGWKVSGTGKIFAGLGCPNGCDFCCTSHFFSRKHIKLLPTGRDIYNVVERYFDLDPNLVFPSSPFPASRPSANTRSRKFWRWALTDSGLATKARGRVTPSSRAARWRRFSPNFASTASRCWPR